jgi:hypothetical protein
MTFRTRPGADSGKRSIQSHIHSGRRPFLVPQANAYQWRYAPALTPTAWIQPDPVTTASYTLTGLTRNTDYIVQSRVLAAKDRATGATRRR